MKQGFTGLFVFWLASAAAAQLPSAFEVQQALEAVQSGQLQVTPEAIDAAKDQYPALRDVPDEKILRKAEEVKGRNPEAVAREAEQKLREAEAADQRAREDEASRLVSRRDEDGARAPRSPDSRSFPDGLKRFGADFFRNVDAGDGLGPNSPSLPEYIVSPGDEIDITIWGRENRTASITIDPEGMFRFPPLEPFRVAGKRFADAQKQIVGEIEKMAGLSASVRLGRLKSIRVMVLGEARRPGSYVFPAGITVTAALFRSGGITDIGSMRDIEVRRNGRTVSRLDVYDMLVKGDLRGDVQLLPGDAIFIPLAKIQVAVTGNVKRPAIYEIRPGSKALDVIALAGGLDFDAHKGRVRLDRVEDNKRNIVLDVDLDKVDARSNVAVKDGDVLYIERVLPRIEDAVFLSGNVNRPGRYQFKKGMTVRDLVPSLASLQPETYLEYAHIRRPAPDDNRPTLLSFSLADVLNKNLRVPLQPRDEVVIYSRYDLHGRPTVKAEGAFRRAGEFTYSEGMVISDLIVLAGGLEDAYLQEAHLRRAVTGARSDTVAIELVKVNLKEALESPKSAQNLALRPGDVLTVFRRSVAQHARSVFIHGAVRDSGTFELADQMRIPELIKMAGGLTKNSYKLELELVRKQVVNDSAMKRDVQRMSLRDILDGKLTVDLQDGDGVYIREIVHSRERMRVTLRGEFRFPGVYEFVEGETMSSVIERAGGFTDEAYVRGLVFLRESVKQQQLRHAAEVSRRLEGQLQGMMLQTTSANDRASISLAIERNRFLLDAIQDAPNLGRVIVKVDKRVSKWRGSEWDIPLEDGDRIIVGPNVSTVSVLGEVHSPSTIIHTGKTNTIGKVLRQAGGINQYGDSRSVMYVDPDGSITTPRTVPWYGSFGGRKVHPGGTVVVPLKPPAKDYLEMWVKGTQVLYQMAISVGVARSLF